MIYITYNYTDSGDTHHHCTKKIDNANEQDVVKIVMAIVSLCNAHKHRMESVAIDFDNRAIRED